MCAVPFGNGATAARPTVPPLREEDLPWCVSADDPRCAPLHHDSAPTQLVARLMVTAHADTPARDNLPNGSQALTPHTGLTPRPGVQERIERPPRTLGRAL
jgi:putative hemolysin